MNHNKNDICIISAGCLLPNANSIDDFWKLINNGGHALSSIQPPRAAQSTSFEDTSYQCDIAGLVDNEIIDTISHKHCSLGLNRLQAMTVHAFSQCTSEIIIPQEARISTILGAMSPDENVNFVFHREYQKIKEIIRANTIDSYFNRFNLSMTQRKNSFYTSSIFKVLSELFRIPTTGFIVDAACASSLSAIGIACQQLQSQQQDLVFCGGIDSYLSPTILAIFARAQALSSTPLKPFDQAHNGTILSEGAVIFALCRVDDAKKFGANILATIKGFGQSSDGHNTSLFSPSKQGQILAYQKAYQSMSSNKIDYLEAHGTGTIIGDNCEFDSISQFWQNQSIPIGTIKTQIGHTKGAAGAAGVLKAILCIKNNLIPSNSCIENPLNSLKGQPYIQTTPINNIKRVGISAFGFGGSNCHLVIEAPKKQVASLPQKSNPLSPIYTIGHGAIIPQKSNVNEMASLFRIPPKSIPQIDSTQIYALESTRLAIECSNLKLDAIDRQRVSVISCSTLGLVSTHNAEIRIRFGELLHQLPIDSDLSAITKHYPPLTEDSGPGILNNVIAGRVCQHYNFKGKSYNLDCDNISVPHALKNIQHDLMEESDLALLIIIDQENDFKTCSVLIKKVSCYILSSKEFISKNALKTYYQIDGIQKYATT